MERIKKIELNGEDIQKFSSHYLNEGRKQESWQINHITIDGMMLNAHVSMLSTYLSATDDNKFHLTVFSALEFLTQLMIAYMHIWAGLEEKVGEVWMIECDLKSRSVIRDPDNIFVSMTVERIKERGTDIYTTASCKITDPQEGLMTFHLKYFLT